MKFSAARVLTGWEQGFTQSAYCRRRFRFFSLGAVMSTGIPKKISSRYCPQFGRIAVEMGIISETQLADALLIQSAEEDCEQGVRLLATIFFEKDLMTSEQIEHVLNALPPHRD